MCSSQKDADEPHDRDLKRRIVVPGPFLPANLSSTSHFFITTKLEHTEASLSHAKSKLDANCWSRPRRDLKRRLEDIYNVEEDQPKRISKYRKLGQDPKLGCSPRPILTPETYAALFPRLAHPLKWVRYVFGSGEHSTLLKFVFVRQEVASRRVTASPMPMVGHKSASLKTYETLELSSTNSKQTCTEKSANTIVAATKGSSDPYGSNTAMQICGPDSTSPQGAENPGPGSSSGNPAPKTPSPSGTETFASSRFPGFYGQAAPLTSRSILRPSVGRLERVVRATEVSEWVPITLDNLQQHDLEGVIVRVDAALCPSKPIPTRGEPARQVRQKSEMVRVMMKTQLGLFMHRMETDTMRGVPTFDWTQIDWASQSSMNQAWTTLIYNEKKEQMTWEGIRPSSIRETASVAITNAYASTGFLDTLEQIRVLARDLDSTYQPVDLSSLGLGDKSAPAGMTDLWGSQIEQILAVVNDCSLYEMSFGKKLQNRGEFNRHEVVRYNQWLADDTVNRDLTASSPLYAIHKRTLRLRAEGDHETVTEKSRSRQLGKSIGFFPVVKCTAYDIASGDVLGSSQKALRDDRRGHPRRIGRKGPIEEATNDSDSVAAERVAHTLSGLMENLIENARRIALATSNDIDLERS